MRPETATARRASGQAPLGRVPLAPLLVGAGALLVFVALAAACIGPVTVPLVDTWHTVVAHLTGDTAGLDPAVDQIVWEYRLPRVVLAVLCGAGLSVAGVVLQALVNNPLADPYVLGLSSGASFGAVLVIVGAGGVVGGLGTSLAAFLGAALKPG